jgi:protein transport protein SEC24
MAAPQEGYPPQGYPAPDPYAQQSPAQPGFPATSPPPGGQAEHDAAGKKKKRGYAAQAYDFGAGANSGLGGQTQGGAPAQPAFGGYPAAVDNQQPAYGAAPQYGAQVGGPAPGAPQAYGQPAQYPGPGYAPPEPQYGHAPAAASPGVAGITQGMGQMGMGAPQAQAQPGAQPQAPGRPTVLNQLYPTDLLNQPFNVAELELPPPPIVLPANVSL